MGSDKFRKDPLYAHAKILHHAACVMRNDCSNKFIKEMPIGKAMVCLQKEQHVGTLYTHKFYERALILEAYESTLLVKNRLEKKAKNKKNTRKKKLGPSVVFYVRLGLLK